MYWSQQMKEEVLIQARIRGAPNCTETMVAKKAYFIIVVRLPMTVSDNTHDMMSIEKFKFCLIINYIFRYQFSLHIQNTPSACSTFRINYWRAFKKPVISFNFDLIV